METQERIKCPLACLLPAPCAWPYPAPGEDAPSRLVRFISTPHPRGKSEAHRAGFFCVPTVRPLPVRGPTPPQGRTRFPALCVSSYPSEGEGEKPTGRAIFFVRRPCSFSIKPCTRNLRNYQVIVLVNCTLSPLDTQHIVWFLNIL